MGSKSRRAEEYILMERVQRTPRQRAQSKEVNVVVAIQKMELVSLVGPIGEFDRVIGQYLSGFNMHIENAMSLLDNVRGLYPYADDNPFAELMGRAEKLLAAGGLPMEEGREPVRAYTREEAEAIVNALDEKLAQNRTQQSQTDEQLELAGQVVKQLEHMLNVEIDLDELFRFQFIKFRFGRLPVAGYKKLKAYLQDIDAFFMEGELEQDYIYGVYFMPADAEERIDGIFSSLYFERIIISGDSHGTPKQAYEAFKQRQENLRRQKEQLESEAREMVAAEAQTLCDVYAFLAEQARTATIRKYAAHTRESFYVVGWVAASDVPDIERALAGEPDVLLVEEEPGIIEKASPPIKLKNLRIFRPFESFVGMYGLPSYNELDPTALFALTYILMFGIMFGDAGHGLVLAIAGFLYYRWKKADIGAVVSLAGVASIVFGIMYGSVFGNETFLKEHVGSVVLITPMEQINLILIATVALGVCIIFLSMFVNLLNAAKNRNWGQLLFHQNGVAGMVFYGSVLLLAVSILTGMVHVNTAVMAALIVVSLLCIFMKEPLGNLAAGKKDWMPENIGDFILSNFFELFEIILSYATNTISFVRLGAFALAHAGMMSVVFIFADMAGAAGSWAVLVVGNILVMGLEGLVVGIQALRLEFYEMFSRFFTGDGRPFVSVRELKR